MMDSPHPAVLDGLLTFDALAAELGVCRRTINRYVAAHTPGLPVVRFGRRPLVKREDALAWLEAHRTQRNPQRNVRRGA